jgi:hypothetical protein
MKEQVETVNLKILVEALLCTNPKIPAKFRNRGSEIIFKGQRIMVKHFTACGPRVQFTFYDVETFLNGLMQMENGLLLSTWDKEKVIQWYAILSHDQ